MVGGGYIHIYIYHIKPFPKSLHMHVHMSQYGCWSISVQVAPASGTKEGTLCIWVACPCSPSPKVHFPPFILPCGLCSLPLATSGEWAGARDSSLYLDIPYNMAPPKEDLPLHCLNPPNATSAHPLLCAVGPTAPMNEGEWSLHHSLLPFTYNYASSPCSMPLKASRSQKVVISTPFISWDGSSQQLWL